MRDTYPGRGSIVTLVLGCAGAFGLAGCAVVPYVPPGQILTGRGMQLQAPPGIGWHKYQDDVHGIYLMKLGPGGDELRSAGVHFTTLPGFSGPDAFLEFAREAVIEDSRLDLFSARHLTFQLRTDRGYACIELHLSGTELHHPWPLAVPVIRQVQIVSLLCEHPAAQRQGFAAVFEHYSQEKIPGIDREAAAFIDSVRPVALQKPARIQDQLPFDRPLASAPELSTLEQHRKFDSMTLYPQGEDVSRPCRQMAQVRSAAPWHGGRLRLNEQREEAVRALRVSAAAVLADAVIDVSCGNGPPPGRPDAAAQVCSGRAVVFQ